MAGGAAYMDDLDRPVGFAVKQASEAGLAFGHEVINRDSNLTTLFTSFFWKPFFFGSLFELLAFLSSSDGGVK